MTGIVAHTYPEWWLKLTGQAAHWSTDYSPDTADELRQVTLKEMHWLCDGLSLNQKDAFEEHHPKIVV